MTFSGLDPGPKRRSHALTLLARSQRSRTKNDYDLRQRTDATTPGTRPTRSSAAWDLGHSMVYQQVGDNYTVTRVVKLLAGGQDRGGVTSSNAPDDGMYTLENSLLLGKWRLIISRGTIMYMQCLFIHTSYDNIDPCIYKQRIHMHLLPSHGGGSSIYICILYL